MTGSVYHNMKVVPQAIQTADAATVNGAGVDMEGYEGVAFIAYAQKGEALSFTIKAQQDISSAFSSAADLAGTQISFATTASADAHVVLDIYQPRERYVRPVLVAPDATSAKAVAIVAIQYGARSRPVANTGEFHQSPAEGTA